MLPHHDGLAQVVLSSHHSSHPRGHHIGQPGDRWLHSREVKHSVETYSFQGETVTVEPVAAQTVGLVPLLGQGGRQLGQGRIGQSTHLRSFVFSRLYILCSWLQVPPSLTLTLHVHSIKYAKRRGNLFKVIFILTIVFCLVKRVSNGEVMG